MKKLAIFLAIMLIPFTAFALDTISDNDLNDVTGQAGVSIYTNSIQIVKTAVTTSYIDMDLRTTKGNPGVGNAFRIVDNGSTTQIFFGGVDPLMIDIVNMNYYIGKELTLAMASNGLPPDARDYGDTGVMITLPDSISIVNYGSLKTYYTGAVTATNELIAVAVDGGTTTISHADQGWSSRLTGSTLFGPIFGTTQLAHDDQVKIIITAHEDY
jgi:hypothetical protein